MRIRSPIPMGLARFGGFLALAFLLMGPGPGPCRPDDDDTTGDDDTTDDDDLEGEGSIRFRVTCDSDGQPVAGATVSIDGPVDGTCGTNGSGLCEIALVPFGTYVVTTSATHHETGVETVDHLVDPTDVDIELVWIPPG